VPYVSAETTVSELLQRVLVDRAGRENAMIAKGYKAMLAQETFLVYLYGTDEEIRHFLSLRAAQAGREKAISRLINKIMARTNPEPDEHH